MGFPQWGPLIENVTAYLPLLPPFCVVLLAVPQSRARATSAPLSIYPHRSKSTGETKKNNLSNYSNFLSNYSFLIKLQLPCRMKELQIVEPCYC